MSRPRVHVRSGCDQCKRRRKKCDEKHPVCSSCFKLHLQCTWRFTDPSRKTNVAVQKKATPYMEINPTSLYADDRETRDRVRIGDHKASVKVDDLMTWNEIATPFAVGQGYPASSTDFARAFDEHIIILGVFFGWNHVVSQYGLDSQWNSIMELDAQTAKCGHGPVARMAAIWCWRVMMKYQTAVEHTSAAVIPPWYLPRQSQQVTKHPPIIDYFPWPGVRELLVADQAKYCTDFWLDHYMTAGFRFMWPYQATQVFKWDESQHMFQVSPEFNLRARNLRSYTMAKDFLEAYPDLRGLAPQLEVSATTYHPSDTAIVENIFWHYVRKTEEHKNLLDRKAL